MHAPLFGCTCTTGGHITFGSVDEVRRDVTPVKLHAFDDLQLVVQRLPILITHLLIVI